MSDPYPVFSSDPVVVPSVTTLIGVGNEYRGDDRLGLEIVRQLSQKNHSNTVCVEQSGEGLSLMELLKSGQSFYLFDAVCCGKAKPGTIYQIDANVQELPSDFFNYSSHNFSVAEAIELLRTLKQLPPQLIVIGIEGEVFDHGVHLSSEVDLAVKKVVTLISKILRFNDQQNLHTSGRI